MQPRDVWWIRKCHIQQTLKRSYVKVEEKRQYVYLRYETYCWVPSICLLSKASSDLIWVWNRRLPHLNFKNLNKLVLNDLVCGLPVLKFHNVSLCATCEQGNQRRLGHPITIDSKIVESLKLLHIDLCGALTIESIAGKNYILVIVDDFSRFTWVYFLGQNLKLLK